MLRVPFSFWRFQPSMCNAIYYQLSTLDLFTVVIVDLYPIDYSYEACFPSPLKMTHNFLLKIVYYVG